MEKMRNFMQSWAGKAVLIITLIPMAFLGVQSFSGGGHIAPDEIIKVGDTAIDVRTFQSEVNSHRNRLMEQVDASLIDEKALSDEILEGLIDRALLEHQTQFFGMTVSDNAITRMLQADPAFLDADGKFSNDLFAQYLQGRGMTKDMLFATFRNQLSLRLFMSGFLGTAIYPENQISHLIDLQTQSREAWVLRYDWQDFADKVSISDAEIQTYYNNHKSSMNQSPSVDLLYVALTDADLKIDNPTEDEILAEYKASNAGLAKQLAHILLTGDDAKARATDIKAKLDAGESFESLAKVHSEDPTGANGGDIGTFNPAFFGGSSEAVESVIDKLDVGKVSDPVQTHFGYHLFKVTKASDAPSMESMRDELIKQVNERKKLSALNDMIAKINSMATDGMGIADIAKEAGLVAHTIKGYTKEKNNSGLSAPAVIVAAFDEFAITEQSVSPNITLSDKTVWVQPTNYQDSRVKSLAEASADIKAILVKQKSIELALKTAQEKSGENADMLTKNAKSLGMVTRQSANLLPAEQASLFEHRADGMNVWSVQTEQGASVMIAGPVQNIATAQISKEERASAAKIIRDNVGQDQLQDYLHYLRDTKEIQINERAMGQ